MRSECKSCKFYNDASNFFVNKKVISEIGLGVCRRNPPIGCGERVDGQVHSDARYGVWPLVYEDDFCGEWKRKR
jgi:hypothetical protein